MPSPFLSPRAHGLCDAFAGPPRLYVDVLAARQVPKPESLRVRASFEALQASTQPVSGSKHPVWNFAVAFPVYGAGSRLTLELLNGEAVVGRAAVAADVLEDERVADVWVRLDAQSQPRWRPVPAPARARGPLLHVCVQLCRSERGRMLSLAHSAHLEGLSALHQLLPRLLPLLLGLPAHANNRIAFAMLALLPEGALVDAAVEAEFAAGGDLCGGNLVRHSVLELALRLRGRATVEALVRPFAGHLADAAAAQCSFALDARDAEPGERVETTRRALTTVLDRLIAAAERTREWHPTVVRVLRAVAARGSAQQAASFFCLHMLGPAVMGFGSGRAALRDAAAVLQRVADGGGALGPRLAPVADFIEESQPRVLAWVQSLTTPASPAPAEEEKEDEVTAAALALLHSELLLHRDDYGATGGALRVELESLLRDLGPPATPLVDSAPLATVTAGDDDSEQQLLPSPAARLPVRRGWLRKLTSGSRARWVRRFFVLEDRMLSYYADDERGAPARLVVDLGAGAELEVPAPQTLVVSSPRIWKCEGGAFVLSARERISVRADSPRDAADWEADLAESIEALERQRRASWVESEGSLSLSLDEWPGGGSGSFEDLAPLLAAGGGGNTAGGGSARRFSLSLSLGLGADAGEDRATAAEREMRVRSDMALDSKQAELDAARAELRAAAEELSRARSNAKLEKMRADALERALIRAREGQAQPQGSGSAPKLVRRRPQRVELLTATAAERPMAPPQAPSHRRGSSLEFPSPSAESAAAAAAPAAAPGRHRRARSELVAEGTLEESVRRHVQRFHALSRIGVEQEVEARVRRISSSGDVLLRSASLLAGPAAGTPRSQGSQAERMARFQREGHMFSWA